MNLGVQRLCQISLAEDHILGSGSNEINFLLRKTVLLTNKNCGKEQCIVTDQLAVMQKLFAGFGQVKIYHHCLDLYHNLFVLLYSSFSYKAVENYGNKNLGIFVLNVQDYLINFYPEVQSVLELYYSLAAVQAELNESGNCIHCLLSPKP